MEATISMPVREFICMRSPHDHTEDQTFKYRFYVNLQDVSPALLNWMTTNPRDQDLNSNVAKAIAASMREDHRQFHLRNRGILFSAKELYFMPDKASKMGTCGTVDIVFDEHGLHGNIDGGHTLRLILQAQKEAIDLPEQFVEFEVITGLKAVTELAEARNTSVALDVRTMESMKGSYDVLKEVFGNVEIGGDRFFDRVELRMNQMLEEKNSIDVRNLISILLMFNTHLFPNEDNLHLINSHPLQMYGGKEVALKKYLELGDGDSDARNHMIRQMSPVFVDIIKLWDTIERELPMINERKYKTLRFATAKKTPLSTFSNTPLPYSVPQSIVFPIIAAFRSLIRSSVTCGEYYWTADPFEVWASAKKSIANSLFSELKTFKNSPTAIVKNKNYWNCLYLHVAVEEARMTVENKK